MDRHSFAIPQGKYLPSSIAPRQELSLLHSISTKWRRCAHHGDYSATGVPIFTARSAVTTGRWIETPQSLRVRSHYVLSGVALPRAGQVRARIASCDL